jgi:hypothetical protein
MKVNVIAENEQLMKMGEPLKVPHDKDPSVILVQYTSLYSSEAAYAVPVVKIEINVLSIGGSHYEMKRISIS